MADGGNKVRTLQHQLAVIESKVAAGDPKVSHLNVIGTGGSNQILATIVHGKGRLPPITPIWMDKDLPDLDNTLNMLSVFSFPNALTKPAFNW